MTHEFQINRNGDTPDTLKKEFIAVMNAARELTAALQAVTVNGRNYQTLADGQSATSRAGQDRAALFQNIEAVRIWAEAGAIRVLNQS